MRRYRKHKKKTFKKQWEEFVEKFRYFVFGPYLEKGEVIVEIFHRHPVIILKDGIKIGTVGIILPLFLALVFPEVTAIMVLWLAVGIFRFSYILVDWYHDVVLVTETTLLDITWEGVFNRISKRLEFNMIEGVTTEILGASQIFMNYGNVIILSVGGNNTLTLKDANRPKTMEMKILDYRNYFLAKMQFKDSEQLKTLVTSMIRNQVLQDESIIPIKK